MDKLGVSKSVYTRCHNEYIVADWFQLTNSVTKNGYLAGILYGQFATK